MRWRPIQRREITMDVRDHRSSLVIVVLVEPVPVASRWPALTRHEAAVAALAARAMTNQQIANRLGISTHTVNYHLRQVFRKLDIRSRVDLARLAQEVKSTAGAEP
jgi:DNA-binding CsgD family transcriptional regulator